MKRLLLAAFFALSLVDCASVNMGDPKQDAAAKTFKAPQGNAGLYIYRNESMGAAVKMDVEIDGKPVGQTGAKTFLYKEVAPGKHTITSKAENTETLAVDAKPGVLYYIWQEVKMGVMSARNKLQLVDEATGKKGVLETNLAETTYEPAPHPEAVFTNKKPGIAGFFVGRCTYCKGPLSPSGRGRGITVMPSSSNASVSLREAWPRMPRSSVSP